MMMQLRNKYIALQCSSQHLFAFEYASLHSNAKWPLDCIAYSGLALHTDIFERIMKVGFMPALGRLHSMRPTKCIAKVLIATNTRLKPLTDQGASVGEASPKSHIGHACFKSPLQIHLDPVQGHTLALVNAHGPSQVQRDLHTRTPVIKDMSSNNRQV